MMIKNNIKQIKYLSWLNTFNLKFVQIMLNNERKRVYM